MECDVRNDEDCKLEPGALVYCRLLVRGVVKVTQAVVVEPGRWQTVVACPGECAVAASGDWAADAASGAYPSFAGDCGAGASCLVLFYCVDSRALTAAALSDAVAFSGGAVPVTAKLEELYRADAGSNNLRMHAAYGDAPSMGPFDEVPLDQNRELFMRNSVVLVPDFFTAEECDIFIEASNSRARVRGRRHQEGLLRMPVCELDLEAQLLSKEVCKDRLLRFIESELPDVASKLWGRSSKLKELQMAFSINEPAINRYDEGGAFNRHVDRAPFTINVLLSEPGAFTGGGTLFWPMDGEADSEPVLLQPQRGAGVLFNGNMDHAGRPVSDGVRHLFVASFDLYSLEEDG